jgi:hypothetical protein
VHSEEPLVSQTGACRLPLSGWWESAGYVARPCA